MCQHLLTCWLCASCRKLSNLGIQATLPAALRELNELVTLALDGNMSVAL